MRYSLRMTFSGSTTFTPPRYAALTARYVFSIFFRSAVYNSPNHRRSRTISLFTGGYYEAVANGLLFYRRSSFPYEWFRLRTGRRTGAIAGTVQDATGAAVPGASIQIISEATGQVVRTFTSDATGVFTANLLPVGNYSVEVSAANFATTKFSRVEVRITETTRITATVKPSEVNEVVEVQSEATTVNTTDATTGESVVAQTITELPLATRNFQQLLDLSAGAAANLNNAASLGRGDVRINVNRGREDNNNYLMKEFPPPITPSANSPIHQCQTRTTFRSSK